MAHQYAPIVEPGGRIVTRRWPDDPAHRSLLEHPRDDLLLEQPEPGARRTLLHRTGPVARARVHAGEGPFTAYRRTVVADGDELVESTEYGVTIPWFGWLFRWPVRGVLARRISAQGWWAPPDRLDPTQLLVLGLLAAASMSAAFVNTLFTQTVSFAADDFGVDNTGVGIAGAFVRVGIVIALPAAVIADRIGRRRVIVCGGLARSAAVGARRDRPDVRRPRRHPDAGAPDGHRPRLPGRRRRRRGDADATAGPTRSASWRWRPASVRESR